MLLALAAGLVIGVVDTSSSWDDTGITAAVLLGAGVAFGVLAPARAWQWALAIGLSIPALTVARHGVVHAGSFLVLAFSATGAYAGALTRRLADGADHTALGRGVATAGMTIGPGR